MRGCRKSYPFISCVEPVCKHIGIAETALEALQCSGDENLRSRATRGARFLDLGSGTGRAVVAWALLRPGTRAHGGCNDAEW